MTHVLEGLRSVAGILDNTTGALLQDCNMPTAHVL